MREELRKERGWDAGLRRSTPGEENWQPTENPEQREGPGYRWESPGQEGIEKHRDPLESCVECEKTAMFKEILTPGNKNIYIRKETILGYMLAQS